MYKLQFIKPSKYVLMQSELKWKIIFLSQKSFSFKVLYSLKVILL